MNFADPDAQPPIVLTLDFVASQHASEDDAEVFSLLFVCAGPFDSEAWPDGDGPFERERRTLSAERLARAAEKHLARSELAPQKLSGKELKAARRIFIDPACDFHASVEDTFGVPCLHIGSSLLYDPIDRSRSDSPRAGTLPALAGAELASWLSERFAVSFGAVCRAGTWDELAEADAPDAAVETPEGRRLFEEAILHLASATPAKPSKPLSL